jgi:hypothetical protein
MNTKRTPISRPPRGPTITPEAIKTFRRIHNLTEQCTCEDFEIDWQGQYWKRRPECSACQERTQQENVLHDVLRLKPWEDAIQSPDAENPYPLGSVAHARWKPNLEAQARYKALATAAGITL